MRLTRQTSIDVYEMPPDIERWTLRRCAVFILGLSALAWIAVGLTVFSS